MATVTEVKIAKSHWHWRIFEQLADDEGVDLDHPDDWYPWWQFFVAGVEAEDQRHVDDNIEAIKRRSER